ncbi:unnamed protein product [Caenorhabditis nigoni]
MIFCSFTNIFRTNTDIEKVPLVANEDTGDHAPEKKTVYQRIPENEQEKIPKPSPYRELEMVMNSNEKHTNGAVIGLGTLGFAYALVAIPILPYEDRILNLYGIERKSDDESKPGSPTK